MTSEDIEAYREEAAAERAEREAAGRQRALESRQIDADLSGVWEGESIDNDENVTAWSDTAMKFRLNPTSWGGSIEGSGTSLWRGMQIDFSVTGRFDWKTKSIELVKQHKELTKSTKAKVGRG